MSELAADVQAFRQYIRAERGMADNTLLPTAATSTASRCGPRRRPRRLPLPDASRIEQLRLVPARPGAVGRPPSVARNLVAVKIFYRFLRLEERTTQTTVDLLASPALWQRIPQVLSHEQVNKLLDAPQPRDRYYLRDRALLETLYATGCRASEVVGLKLADLHLQSGFCKCVGKGNKQRIVPLGRIAINALEAYLTKQRAAPGRSRRPETHRGSSSAGAASRWAGRCCGSWSRSTSGGPG